MTDTSNRADTDTDTDTRTATAVFTWDVEPGRGADFEHWAHGIHRAAAQHPGHLGATWLRAEGIRHRYYTVVNFADEDRLAAWVESSERAEWIKRLNGIAKEYRHHTTGSRPGSACPVSPCPPQRAGRW